VVDQDSKSNVVAIIPARSGSKRLPGKNIKLLAGKPLINWTIEAAISSNIFSRIIVSTDSEEIAEVAREAGADIPWLRPDHLATDTSTSFDVVEHAVNTLQAENEVFDAIMVLQPTSPFRSLASIRKAAELFESFHQERSIVSVGPAPAHPAWCNFRDDDGKLLPCLETPTDSRLLRSQDLEPVYVYNGLIYMSSVWSLMQHKAILSPNTYSLVIDDEIENIDIDNGFDWLFAEFAAQKCSIPIN
jgi:CMP-N,N'-diacetyllegionaminic acid synthase